MDATAGADVIVAAIDSVAGRTGGCILGQDAFAVFGADSAVASCARRGGER